MGVILSVQLSANLRAAGAAAAGFSLDTLLRPVGGAAPTVNIALREALTAALQSVFVAALIAAVAGLVVTALAPRGNVFRVTPAPEAIEADASAAH
jgi:putative flippase GtrA